MSLSQIQIEELNDWKTELEKEVLSLGAELKIREESLERQKARASVIEKSGNPYITNTFVKEIGSYQNKEKELVDFKRETEQRIDAVREVIELIENRL